MSATEEVPGLSAQEAIKRAFSAFDDYMGERPFSHRLLEGVEFDEHQKHWQIIIGFDAGRTRELPADILGGGGAMLSKAKEPIREFRTFVIDDVSGRVLAMR